jgi:cytochrome c553
MSGEELFGSCDSCHGKAGQGNATLGAPPIAGLPKWYIEAQVHKFRTGLRGAHPDDVEGLRMRAMSRSMANDEQISSVAAYISQLPRAKAAGSLEGVTPQAGKPFYATCMACHGPQGAGNEAMRAPPIAGQADWYLMRQLTKFRHGVRGAVQGDAQGAQMRPMAMTLPNDQAVKDVVAYIGTLNP